MQTYDGRSGSETPGRGCLFRQPAQGCPSMGLWHGGRATACGATAGRSPAPWMGRAAGLASGPWTSRAGGEAAARRARRLCEAGGTARRRHGKAAARRGGDTALAAPRRGGLAWWRLGEAAAG